MNWDTLNIAIVVVFLLQLVVWVGVALAVLAIKRGPVDGVIARIKPMLARGKALVGYFPPLASRLKARTLAIVGRSQKIRGAFVLPDSLPGMWISPRTIRQVFQASTVLRGTLSKSKPTAKPKKRRSVPDRLGLIPPAAKYAAPLYRGAKTALSVAKQLRKSRS